MVSRRLLAAAGGLALATPFIPRAGAQSRPEVQFWYGLGGPLGEIVQDVVKKFNESQSQVTVVATFKGSYVETLTAAIAAWRANQAPHIVQMFEVGTGSMMAAGPAIKPVHQLFADAGMTVDVNQYLPGVRGYYSTTDGKLMSMPFNSSTSVMWYNKDAFKAAGLDPEKPPATWPALREAAKKLLAAKATPGVMTTSWPTWIQFEQLGAIHDKPFATLANGFGGLGTELQINAPLFVNHLTTLVEMNKEGTFKYGGRDNTPDPLFPAGDVAIGFMSSGSRAQIARDSKFAWAPGFLPFYPDAIGSPINSVIGGASLWVMTAPNRSATEYKGVAEFFQFLSRPENDADWHQRTGYVPITFGGYELSRKQGFYEKNPGADLPIQQLTRGTMTDNSKGFRLGRMVELRNIIQEEMEKSLQGNQTPKQALDLAVSRGNRVLRDFERQNRG
jgi:sn-glycerol 3-phosphate transport system substrate-binding protein